MRLLLVSTIFVLLDLTSGFLSNYCGRSVMMSSYRKRNGVCCNQRYQWLGPNSNGACCGNVGYNPSSQICCAGIRFSKKSINTGCCYGKYYQRGKELCCGGKLIDVKTEGCCRNEPFKKAYEECCDGERVPNLFQDNVPRECCGKELFDKRKQVCCAEKIVKKVAGAHTKCCVDKPYDSRAKACCNAKIIPIVPGLSECCHGKMINPQEKFCCDFKIQDREYGASTGCCRLALWKYIVYNKNKHICCARELQERKPYRPKSKFSFIARQEKMGPLEHAKAMARVSCCNQRAYDTLHQICCALRVHTRRVPNQRCCGSRPYDRNKNICCDGKMFRLYSRSEYCCGRRKYDRRRFQCKLIDKRYKVVSLNFNEKDKDKPKPIDVFLAKTTEKSPVLPKFPELPKLPSVPGLSSTMYPWDSFYFGKTTPMSKINPTKKTTDGLPFDFGRLPDEFFLKDTTKKPAVKATTETPWNELPEDFFKSIKIKTTSKAIENPFHRFTFSLKTTPATRITMEKESDGKLFEVSVDLIAELEKFEKEQKAIELAG